jgi:hypothetical protein
MTLDRRLNMLEERQRTRLPSGIAYLHLAFVWMVPEGHMEWPVKIPKAPLQPDQESP